MGLEHSKRSQDRKRRLMVRPAGPRDIRDRLALITDPTERAGARALECKIATADIVQGSSVEVDGLTLVFDASPAFIRNKRGEVVGLDAMVRVYEGGVELQVDPHRMISNPPTCVPDGTFHDEFDELGRTYQVSNYREAPREAWLLMLAQSVRLVPHEEFWRPR